jgi:hypothetical protein
MKGRFLLGTAQDTALRERGGDRAGKRGWVVCRNGFVSLFNGTK